MDPLSTSRTTGRPRPIGRSDGHTTVSSTSEFPVPWPKRPSGRMSHAGAPRFRALYRAWLERGDPVLEATLSPVLRDAIERRTGRIEHHVLPHAYLHLAPLVGTA